jgi:O-antigen/teichoic acid export membrane protein
MPSIKFEGKGSFLGDVLKIAGGTTFAQALSVLATPILTRIYGPESYGLSALFVSIVASVGVVSCLRYELAIMLPKRDEDAANLLAASLILAGVISVLTIPITYYAGNFIILSLKSPALNPYLWLIPLAVFLNGVVLAFNYWISRTRHFGSLSVARVASSIATTGTQLGAGFSGYATGGSLIIANIIGSAASATMLGVRVWGSNMPLLKSSLSRQGILDSMKRYAKFPLIDSWSALLNTLSWQLPVFLLSTFFSSTVVGYYGLSMMVLQFPATLIGGAISQVFFQRAAEAKFEGKLPKVVEDTVLRLIILGLFPMLLLSVMGKEAFIVVFGTAWSEAGLYSQILALWIFITFIASPISTLLSIFEKQGASLIFNIILLIMRAGALVAGGLLGDAHIAIALFALVGIVIYSMLFFWLLSVADVSFFTVWKGFRKYAAYSIPLIVGVIYAKWILLLSPIILVVIAGAATTIYCIAIITNNSDLLPAIFNIKKRQYSK